MASENGNGSLQKQNAKETDSLLPRSRSAGKQPKRSVTWFTALFYGCGVIMNDMTAGLWFSYLLFFLHEYRGVSPRGAALVILSGQIADAIFTPTAGHLSDYTESRFGRRKPWIFGGSIVVALSFAFMFFPVPHFDFVPDDYFSAFTIIWYSFFACLFNFGWASVQVAHMSLVPELTDSEPLRLRLNSVRFAFTVFSNLLVFLLASVVFRLVEDPIAQFEDLSMLALLLGSVGVLVCVLGVHERPLLGSSSSSGIMGGAAAEVGEEEVVERVPWSYWFKYPLYYQMGFVYMCARLVVVLVQVALPFYIKNQLQLGEQAIALAPLALQLASLSGSFGVPLVNRILDERYSFILGALICVGACSAMAFLTPASAAAVYVVALFAGVGIAAIAVTALTFTAGVVGDCHANGAFVYGSYGFLEKLSGGIAIYVMESLHLLENGQGTIYCISIVPIAASVAAVVMLLLVWRPPSSKEDEGRLEAKVRRKSSVGGQEGYEYFALNLSHYPIVAAPLQSPSYIHVFHNDRVGLSLTCSGL
mmetsp:Transcript_36937/g.59757  ORF Transcript_36937/g.59757 Transcript_36937/m.59757 type:complete len:533 (-) Transcript_36937:343-1941(-)